MPRPRGCVELSEAERGKIIGERFLQNCLILIQRLQARTCRLKSLFSAFLCPTDLGRLGPASIANGNFSGWHLRNSVEKIAETTSLRIRVDFDFLSKPTEEILRKNLRQRKTENEEENKLKKLIQELGLGLYLQEVKIYSNPYRGSFGQAELGDHWPSVLFLQ